jgi:hypothetical protein
LIYVLAAVVILVAVYVGRRLLSRRRNRELQPASEAKPGASSGA